MTYINDEVSRFCPNCEVYNLGIAGDKPSKRIQRLAPLIEMDPDIVIYGVGYPDFAFQERNEKEAIPIIEKPDSPLPDPQDLFNGFLSSNFPNDVNPKYFTLNVIKNLIEGKKETLEMAPDPSDRLFKVDKDFEQRDYLVYDNEELKEKFPEMINENSKIDSNVYDRNSNALRKIIERLQDNGIRVSLVTTPTPQAILDKVSDSDVKIFDSTFEEISKESKINTYYLHGKISDLKIWANALHVTLDPAGMPYTEEIADIVKKEVAEI